MRMASLAAALLVLGRVFSPSRAAPLGRSALGKSIYTCMHCSIIALALFACICVQTAAAEIELMSTSVHAVQDKRKGFFLPQNLFTQWRNRNSLILPELTEMGTISAFSCMVLLRAKKMGSSLKWKHLERLFFWM